MKGDRFEKIVEKVKRIIWKDCAPVLIGGSEPSFYVITKEDATKLLRKEHAAVTRMVKNTHKITVAAFKQSILKALDKRAKGGTT